MEYEGLTKKESVEELNYVKKEISADIKLIEELARNAGASLNNFQKIFKDFPKAGKEINNLQDQLKSSLETYSKFKELQQDEIKRLKQKGATDEQILKIREKYKAIEEDAKSKRDSALSDITRNLGSLIDQGKLSVENSYIAKKQLNILEKTFELQEDYNIRKLRLDRQLDDNLRGINERQKEGFRSGRDGLKKEFFEAIPAFLGPLRIIADPLIKLTTGQSSSEASASFFGGIGEKRKVKRDYKKELKILKKQEYEDKKINKLEEDLDNLDKDIFENKETKNKESSSKKDSSENSFLVLNDSDDFLNSFDHKEIDIFNQREKDILDQDEPDVMDKVTPDESILLAKGGVIGAGVVYLARQLGVGDKKKPGKVNDGDGIGGLGKLGKLGGILKAAVPLLMMAGGAALFANAVRLQKRDSEDARSHFAEGNTARGIETWILGDRSRTTEENASQELGRTVGKTTSAVGGLGLFGAGAIGTGAMVGKVAGAGGLAKAGGIAAVGKAGLAAAGAALPPVLIGAAVVAGVTAVAKGTQQAFELEWDKNQANIQNELHSVMYSGEASMIEKIKAGGASIWKGFTGTLAGGIREAGEVMDVNAKLHAQRQKSFLEEQAEAGSEAHANLLQVMQSEEFREMSKRDKKRHLKGLGLYDTYKDSRRQTKDHKDGLRVVGGFFRGMSTTAEEGRRGKATARWERDILKGKTFASDEEKQAYIQEMREKAIADGTLREDGQVAEAPPSFLQKHGAKLGTVASAIAGGPLGALAFNAVRSGRKFLGFGKEGMSYKYGSADEAAEGFKGSAAYERRKAELMLEGLDAEQASEAALEEQRELYEQSLEIRLMRTKDYRESLKKYLREGKSQEEAERAALNDARENTRNTKTMRELVKDKFEEYKNAFEEGGIGAVFSQIWSSITGFFTNMANTIRNVFSGIDIWEIIDENIPDSIPIPGRDRRRRERANRALDETLNNSNIPVVRDYSAGDVVPEASRGTGIPPGLPVRPPSRNSEAYDSENEDVVIYKDGKRHKVSDDDNIYATKNPINVLDRVSQAAMPSVPKSVKEFTDVGIIEAIRVLTEVLKSKEMQPIVVPSITPINCDQFRSASYL